MKMVTTNQALELLQERGISVSYPTVAQWTREGRFEGAEREETERGPVWRIPVDSVKKFDPPKIGRPKSAPATQKRATGRKNASNGTATTKSRAKKGGKK
jgi:hypothetical protein